MQKEAQKQRDVLAKKSARRQELQKEAEMQHEKADNVKQKATPVLVIEAFESKIQDLDSLVQNQQKEVQHTQRAQQNAKADLQRKCEGEGTSTPER